MRHTLKRRTLFQGLALGSLMAPAARAEAPRKALARHRNLFNGDSCTYFYNPELWQPEGGPFSAKAIHRYVDLLADSGIDTFLINPNAQVAWYPSKKLQTVIDGYRRGNREFFRGHAIAVGTPPEQMDAYLDHMVKFFNLYLDLVEAGIDWLAETSQACRRRGISPWVSVRMNDMHGAANPTGSHFNCALFKQPKYRLSGRALDPRDGAHLNWGGLNYEHAEVRDFMLANIREFLEDYDYEGVELDWLRNPLCCEPPAGARQLDLMTSWIAEVRRHTDARARKLGKPCPLGMRIPASLGYVKSIGMDVPRLVREGLIDFLGFSNFWQTTWDVPYDELRAQLGPDVVFYGVVEDAPNWVNGYAPSLQGKTAPIGGSYPNLGIRYMAASAPMLHANAAGKLVLGVEGIEQFNFFCTDQVKIPGLRGDYAALKHTSQLDLLRGKPKHYCLESPSGRVSNAFEMPEPVPAILEPKGRREFRLSMCREPAGARLTVQVVVEKQSSDPALGVSFNGYWPTFEKQSTRAMLFPVGPYTEHIAANQAYNFECSAADIRDGWNRVLVINNSQPGQPDSTVKVVSLELGVQV